MAFGFGGLLGGGAIPDVQMPDGLPIAGGRGSPLVDAFLALQGQRIKDAVTAPRDAFTGDLQVMGPDGHPTAEAMDRASGLAGLAMTGSMPFKAPKGALRMFGGGEAHEDPLAALSAALDQNMGSVASDVRPISRVDTSAKSWDLYHGTSAPDDFARFDPNRPQATRTHSPGSEAGAVFLSPAADEAAHYAGDVIGKDTIPGAGPRVIRTTVDPGKTAVLDIPHLLENDPSFVARARENFIQNDAKGRAPTEAEASRLGAMFDDRHARMLDEFRTTRDLNDQLAALGYPASEVPQAQWGFGATGAAIQRAKEQGLDTAVLRGLSESNGGDQVVALTPGRVRSYYDPSQVLFNGGPAGAAAGLPALASSSDPKGASVSAGLQIPSLGDLSPEMQAQIMQMLQQGPQAQPAVPSPVDSLLFDRAGMGGGANGFSGTSGTVMPPQAAQASERPVPQVAAMPSPQATGAIARPAPVAESEDAPAAPTPAPAARPAPAPQVPASQASAPAAGMQPVNSFDPLTGQPVSGSPRPLGQPAAAAGAKPSGGFDLGSALGRMNQSGLSDQLIAIGAGIMSGRTFGEGLGEGLSNAQRVASQAMAGRLAQAKVDREQAAAAGNAAIYKKYFPNATPEEALAGGSNSSIMTELMKRGLPATETYRQETDDNGIWQVNTANGQRSLLKAAEKDQSVKPVTEEERASLGLPPGVYQRDANGKVSTVAQAGENKTVTQIPEAERAQLGLPAGAYQRDANGKISPINPTGTTINMGAEKAQDATVGKSFGDYQVDLATKGRNAANTLNSLALMEQAMKTPGFYSGVGGEGVKRANQFLAALGVKDPRAASATEVFDALSNKVVLDGLGGSLGPGISNTDRDYIARTAPTLAQSQQGNSDLIGVARTLAQRQQVVAKLAREYAAGNNGRLDSGFDAKLEEYASQNPLFPQAAAGANASPPREAPQGAPSGARQAPDGQWYVSDPNRPGKYLKVQ